MSSLVLCPCLHAVEGHDAYGCKGDRTHRCACRLAAGDALDAAIDAVRSTYTHQRLRTAEAQPDANRRRNPA